MNRLQSRIIKALTALLLCLAVSTEATAKDKGLQLTISQQRLHTNGVLISQPDPIDMRIMHLVNANGIRSLEDYAGWLKTNILYKSDGPKDSWSPADQTLRRKTGDCEDYAFLNIAVLKVLGFKPQMFILSGKDGYHAICAFVKDGTFSLFDNNRLKETTARSIPELARLMANGQHFSTVHEVDLSTQKQRLIYRKI